MTSCSRCGAPMDDGDNYCAECGAPRHDDSTLPEASAVEADAGKSAAAKPVPAPKPGRRLLVAAAIVLFALCILLAVRFLQVRQPGVHPSRASDAGESTETALTDGPQGLYLLSAYGWGEGQSDERGQWYLLFNADGSGRARLFDQDMGFSCSSSRLVFDDGSSMPYTLDGDTLTLQGGTTLVFSRADTQPAAVTPTPEPGALPLNSRWHGLLEISGHKGEGSLEDGQMEVSGLLGETESGRQFFELYDAHGSEEDPPLLSMWVNVYGDHMVPAIGEEDAWFFDLWLQESDTKALTLYYKSGSIRCNYRYQLDGERCSISFRVVPDA